MSRASYLIGDVFDRLAEIPDGSVDLVLTSPPFLALRSYLPADHPDKGREIGSEATPAAFIDTLLRLTAEWRRVLAPHGSICVELGDTYSGSGGAGGDYGEGGLREGQQAFSGSASKRARLGIGDDYRPSRSGRGDAWPLAKSLCGIPHLYHLSLAYGRNLLTGEPSPAGQWRVRNVIAWCRPNPPVGALGDKFRPATSYMTVACVSGSRYFDLDAVRSNPEDVKDQRRRTTNGPKQGANPAEVLSANYAQRVPSHPAGAPPLDWWAIPTQPYVTPAGTLIVPAAGTFHQVRVPVDAGGDGIRRTTSPGCPVHGSPDHPGSSAPGGEHAGSGSSHNEHSADRPARGLEADSHPTSSSTGQLAWDEDPADPAAIPRSTSVHRTAPAPATTPAGTPSDRTTARTGDRSTGPVSSAPHPGTSSSSSAGACPPVAEHGREPRTAHTSDPSSACTCSHYVEVSVASESTSDYATWPDDNWNIPTHGFPGAHYATWPAALCARPILAMCPQRVCTVCGEPSRRIVGDAEYVALRQPFTEDQAWGDTRVGMSGSKAPASRIAPTLGWSDCQHNTWRNGVVLDPFAGSGTTLAVATGHGRDAIGIDIDGRNLDLARDRIGMFLEVGT